MLAEHCQSTTLHRWGEGRRKVLIKVSSEEATETGTWREQCKPTKGGSALLEKDYTVWSKIDFRSIPNSVTYYLCERGQITHCV